MGGVIRHKIPFLTVYHKNPRLSRKIPEKVRKAMSFCDSAYHRCTLCAHRCGVARDEGERGVCRMGDTPRIARAALHFYEEPPISGKGGSGAVFFSGCSLGCIYCQNREISHGGFGVEVDENTLASIYLRLEKEGAENINLVTPTHFAPSVISSVAAAREAGLSLPIVYNTSSYETPETVDALDGTVDVFLADMKYHDTALAKAYSAAADYPAVAREAISHMVRLRGTPVYDARGMLRSGVVVRLLLLPGHVANSCLALHRLYETYGDHIVYSLMNQYTPPEGMLPPLHRGVTREEYRAFLRYAEKIGISDAFIQEEGTATESFRPPFDLTGVPQGKNF